MGWLSVILAVIQYGPAVYNLVVEIIELIKKLKAEGRTDEAKFAEATLRSGVSQYKKAKDRRVLRALRDRLRSDCYGDNCPTGPRAA